jgi:hypothetical protein
MHGRRHGPRRLNSLEHRSPTVLTDADAILIERDSSTEGEAVVSKLPTNRTAVIAICSGIVAFLALCIAVYMYRTRKSRKTDHPSLAGKVIFQREQRTDSPDHFSAYSEKPEKIYSRPSDEHVGWVPQIKAYSAAPIQAPQPAVVVKSKTKEAQFAVVTLTEDDMELARTPPPVYMPSTPNLKQKNLARDILPMPTSPSMEFEAVPLPSPPPANHRASSLEPQKHHHSSAMSSPKSPIVETTKSEIEAKLEAATAAKNKKLPRLMNVITTFAPTLDDELLVKVGETIRLVDEYNDGWCLVQRVGKVDAPKGVVPRFCLEERRGIVPIITTTDSRIHRKGSAESAKSYWSPS